MKKILILTLLTAMISPAFAQLGGAWKKAKKRMGERIERKLENKVERKVDQKIDRAIDRIFDKKRDNGTTASNGTTENAGGSIVLDEETRGSLNDLVGALGGTKDDIASSYTFVKTINWKISSTGDEPSEMTQQVSADGQAIAFTAEQAVVIQDFDNMRMVTIGEDKTLTIINLEAIVGMGFVAVTMDEDSEENNFEIKETGRTKTIAGYRCEQVIVKNDGVETEVWFARELKGMTDAYYQHYMKTSPMAGGFGKLSGMMLEMKQVEKNGEVNRMEVTSISNQTVSYDMSDYELANMKF